MSEENITTAAVNGTEQTQPEATDEATKPSKGRAPRKKISTEELEIESAKVDEMIENEQSDSTDATAGIVDRRSVPAVPESPVRKRKPVDRNAYRRIKKFNGRINL